MTTTVANNTCTVQLGPDDVFSPDDGEPSSAGKGPDTDRYCCGKGQITDNK